MNDFYNETHQYHDAKWLFIDVISSEMSEDIKKMIIIKKKPNRKQAGL